jgi:hypothetical protein
VDASTGQFYECSVPDLRVPRILGSTARNRRKYRSDAFWRRGGECCDESTGVALDEV